MMVQAYESPTLLDTAGSAELAQRVIKVRGRRNGFVVLVSLVQQPQA